jgi:putative aldouronate transport system substrate-binding protein
VKRILVLLTLLALVLPAFAEGGSEASKIGFKETGLPIVDKPVTIKVFGQRTPNHRKPFNELPVPAKAEKETNVHVEWIEVPTTGITEKKNLMLASGDLPDAFAINMPDFDIVNYGAAKVFVPLQDLISKYAPNYKKVVAQKPDMAKFTKAPDGNTYTFARLNEGSWMRQTSIHYIYKPWVDKIGKGMPKTLDEFFDFAQAVKRTDLNGNGKADEMPIAWAAGESALGIPRTTPWFVFYAFGLPDNDTGNPATTHLFVEGGRVKFGPVEERYKSAIAYLSKLWKAGLIEPEAFTLTQTQLQAKARAVPVTYAVYSVWNIQDEWSLTDPRVNDYAPLPFITAPGVAKATPYRMPYPGWNRGHMAITKANKYPEVTVRWVDYLYDTYNSIEWIEGLIGSRLTKDAKGVVTIKDPPPGVNAQEWRMAETQPDVPLAATMEMYKGIFPFPMAEIKGSVIEAQYLPAWPKEFWTNPLIALDDMKQLNAMDPDINSYVTKTMARWVTQGGVEADWADYLKQLDKLGLSKMMQIRQAAYERSLK